MLQEECDEYDIYSFRAATMRNNLYLVSLWWNQTSLSGMQQ